MKWKWLAKMAWRDSRKSRGRLLLFMTSIVVGIAALVAINSFGDNLRKDIDAQAGELLGADMVIETRIKPDAALSAFLDSLGGRQAYEASFASMLYFPKTENSRLVEVRALKGDYPFYGRLETEPKGVQTQIQQEYSVVLVDRNAMLQYDAEVGDSVRIGQETMGIAGNLLQAPGRTGLASTFAPVVYMPMERLDETGLIRKGSRVVYKRYYRFDDRKDVGAIAEAIKPRLRKDNIQVETLEDRKESIGEAFTNLTRFLNLVAFIALLLGSLGVASAVHIYIKDKLNTVAILRCLGTSGRQSFMIFLIQVVSMGLIGSTLGALLGSLIQVFLPMVLNEFLPFEASTRISWRAMGQGVVIGITISLLFALLPLLAVRKISPLNTLRAAYETTTSRLDLPRLLVGTLIILFIIGFAFYQVRSWEEALGFAGAIAMGFLVLAGTARGVMWLARRYFPVRWNFLLRQGLANLFRPNNQTLILMIAIGLGTAMITTLFFVQGILLSQLNLSGRNDSPNIMLFDIQSSQREDLAQLTRDFDLPVMQDIPIVTMRVHTLDGRTKQEVINDSTANIPGWVFNNELRVTFRDSLIESEEILEGSWIPYINYPEDTVYISLEEGFADRINVELGDPIEFNVQGAIIPTVVGSIRKMEFDRMNFLILFPRGVLEQAPQFYIITTRADSVQQAAAYQRAVVKQYPTVSVIDLGLILNTIDQILNKIGFVIQFMSLFSIITGLLVLIGSVIISKYQRIQESVLLRTIGAQRRQILWINALEYIFLGSLAALTGILLSLLFSWILARFNFDTAFNPQFFLPLLVWVSVAALTTFIGLLNVRGVLNQPPLEVLRKEI